MAAIASRQRCRTSAMQVDYWFQIVRLLRSTIWTSRTLCKRNETARAFQLTALRHRAIMVGFYDKSILTAKVYHISRSEARNSDWDPKQCTLPYTNRVTLVVSWTRKDLWIYRSSHWSTCMLRQIFMSHFASTCGKWKLRHREPNCQSQIFYLGIIACIYTSAHVIASMQVNANFAMKCERIDLINKHHIFASRCKDLNYKYSRSTLQLEYRESRRKMIYS